MRKSILLMIPTVIAAALLVWGARALGASSAAFAFLVVWVPMTWLGTVSRVVQPRLPRSYHELRDFERDGSLYERLGVRLVKRLLRNGPIAVFNPDLHLPAERTPERLAHLDQRMRDAEASHFILLVATSGVAIHAAARGWWVGALLTLVFDVLMNGYPVMLQRYNRALLHRRFAPLLDEDSPPGAAPVREQPIRARPLAAGRLSHSLAGTGSGLRDGPVEMCVCDISEAAEIPESTASHVLRLLRTARIVHNRRDGIAAGAPG